MARSIKEINDAMIFEKKNDPTLNVLEGDSSASIWRTLFYIVAAAIYTLEKIFDLHKKEVSDTIEDIIPHRPKWYRDMALKFMKDTVLIDETDRYDTTGMSEKEIGEKRIVTYATVYDTTGMTEEDIKAKQIIKYAIAEDLYGHLLIKIATGEPGNLKPIPDGQDNTPDYLTEFKAYMNEIRDAGVRITVVNEPGDRFNCGLIIYYDPMKLVEGNDGMKTTVQNAIKNYITNLPFNGEYSNMSLVDTVQAVSGVRVVTFQYAKIEDEAIKEKVVPIAGYFSLDEENIENSIKLTFMAYEVGQQL